MKLSRLALVGAVAIGMGACGSDSQPIRQLDAGSIDAGASKDAAIDAAATDAAGADGGPSVEVDAQAIDTGVVDAAAEDVGQTVDGSSDGSPVLVDASAADAGAELDGGQRFNAAYVELKRASFQSVIDGKSTDLFTIKNSKGMFAKITNLGAKLEQIVVPDKTGVFGDVILGYETIDTVKGGQPSMGAFIGRYVNRIAGGTFELDGDQYSIAINETALGNLLHSGAKGSRFRVFDAQQLSDSSVEMSLTFADAEDADATKALTGFPGTLALKVVYSVTESNEMHIAYSATALDKKTVVSFTGHSFFNLSNTPASTILDHVIQVNADRVLEINDKLVPNGTLRDVTDTPMDFRTPKTFAQDYKTSYDLLNLVGGGGAGVAGGYDNHYALNKTAPGVLAFAASAYEPISGRKMEVWTTEPGMQLFTGQNLTGQAPRDVGKGGVTYMPYYAFCMEPSHFPDSPNHPDFPTTELGPGETYSGSIIYKFSVVP